MTREIILMLTSQRIRLCAAVVALLPVLYLAGFGPAAWMVDRGWIAPRPVAQVYWPVLWGYGHGDWGAGAPLRAYVRAGASNHHLTVNRLLHAANLGGSVRDCMRWTVDKEGEFPCPSSEFVAKQQ